MRFPILLLGVVAFLATYGRAMVASGETVPENEINRQIAHAEELFEQGHTAQSRQICESVLSALPDHPSAQRASALNLTSKIYAVDGDYDRAIDSARRSAVAYEYIRDASGEAHALNNKGIAELQAGKYSDAQLDLQKALILSQTGNDAENQVQVLNNLGSAYYFLGSYSEATRNYDDAMFLVNANASAKWNDYWLQITKFNQATLLQRLGRYDGALRIYREVAASSKILSDCDRAHLEANLGTIYRRLGDPYKAMDSYRAAQRLYAKQHDADGEIAVLKNMGIAYALDLNDLTHAADIFRSSLALSEKTHNRREEMQAHLYLGETLFRAGSFPLARQEFELAQSGAKELGTEEEQWKSLYGLARIEASGGDFESAERDYRGAIALIERSRSQLQLSALRSDFFADKREAYDGLLSILFKRNNVKEAFLFLEKSRSRNFQDRMQEKQQPNVGPLTLESVQASLGPETELLEFWASGDQIGVIWCTHEAAGVKLKQFTPAQQAQFQDALRNIPDHFQLADANGESFFDAVLDDTLAIPPGVHHLLIVPDTWLSYVPFDLLRTERGSSTLLIERCDITYLPSATLMRAVPTDQRVYGPWTRELVAFGDPVVKAEGAKSELANMDQPAVQSLPYSAKEIEDISHLTRGASHLFLQRENLKKNFLNGFANSALLLHVSTHAFADVDRPEDSRLLFSPEEGDSESSYLFLRELYALDLTHVNMATISACDTERGKILRGEGIQAFSRALLSAGARSSITALWRVDDQATAEFMQQFYYFALRENTPKANALRLAKLKFLRSKSRLSDPAVWAAFVLNGDGLTPTPRVLSWAEVAAGVAALTALLVLFSLIAARLWSRRSGHGQHSPRSVVAQ
jgi:CHAT domain-containing protein/Flp pilus assembly protein TadD